MLFETLFFLYCVCGFDAVWQTCNQTHTRGKISGGIKHLQERKLN